MSDDSRPVFTPHLVIGLGIMAVGVVIFLDRFRIVDAIAMLRLWPVLLILLGVAVIAQGLSGRRGAADAAGWGGPLMILLVIIVLVAAADRRIGGRYSAGGAEQVNLVAVLSRQARTPTSEAFRGAMMTSIMGGSTLDLRQLPVAPGEEVIVDAFGLMGGVDIHVPPGWTVDMQAVTILGGASDERENDRRRRRDRERRNASDVPLPLPEPAAEAGGPAAKLIVRGFMMMGAIEIKE